MSTITVIALFFVIFLGVFAIMIWLDRKTTYILPKKFNYNDGESECSGEQSEASHQENRKTGEIVAKASTTNSESASASAQLGFEYQNPATKAIKLIVTVSYEYQIYLNADSDQSKVTGKVETAVNSTSAKISSASLPLPENASKPQSGELKKGSKRHAVTLQPGEGFTAYLKFTAEVEGAETGKCSSQVNGKLTEVSYRPEVGMM